MSEDLYVAQVGIQKPRTVPEESSKVTLEDSRDCGRSHVFGREMTGIANMCQHSLLVFFDLWSGHLYVVCTPINKRFFSYNWCVLP